MSYHYFVCVNKLVHELVCHILTVSQLIKFRRGGKGARGTWMEGVRGMGEGGRDAGEGTAII